MLNNINIFDNFYNKEEWGLACSFFYNEKYVAHYQPADRFFANRFQAYPVWETTPFKSGHPIWQLTKQALEKKLNIKITYLDTRFRKIYTSEILQSDFKNDIESLKHVDNLQGDPELNYAGVVYFNNESLQDGTRIFSSISHREPDVIVGSKINRLVCYHSELCHSAGIDKRFETRFIQPIFFTIEKQ